MINIAIHKIDRTIISWSASYYEFINPQEYCVAKVELPTYPPVEELDMAAIGNALYIDADGKLASDTLNIVSQTINENYVEPPPVVDEEVVQITAQE